MHENYLVVGIPINVTWKSMIKGYLWKDIKYVYKEDIDNLDTICI